MKRIPAFALMLSLAAAAPFATTGCGQTNSKTGEKTKDAAGRKDDHPTEGLHHGLLVELGDHEYHAEITHSDETGIVTVYILDASVKKQVPIDATEVIINVKLHGKPKQFKLPALPDKNDPQGKSSRFQLKDKELVEAHDAKGAEAKLVVNFTGGSFNVPIEPGHTHAH